MVVHFQNATMTNIQNGIKLYSVIPFQEAALSEIQIRIHSSFIFFQ
jgi:hypothetical protein